MAFRNVLAGIAVIDIETAKAWYTRFLGREPDDVPMENDAEWRFEAGGQLQVFRDAERAGKSSITLETSGIDGECERLKALDVAPLERSDGGPYRLAIFHDPDGNQIVLAEAAD